MAIKINSKFLTVDGKRVGVSYGLGPYITLPEGTITIYPKRSFPREIYSHFEVENLTDLQTDYFEEGRIRVFPSHPLYSQIKEAANNR